MNRSWKRLATPPDLLPARSLDLSDYSQREVGGVGGISVCLVFLFFCDNKHDVPRTEFDGDIKMDKNDMRKNQTNKEQEILSSCHNMKKMSLDTTVKCCCVCLLLSSSAPTGMQCCVLGKSLLDFATFFHSTTVVVIT